MVEVLAATLTGTETVLEDAAIGEFKASLRGQLVLPDDQDYDDARNLFRHNQNIKPTV